MWPSSSSNKNFALGKTKMAAWFVGHCHTFADRAMWVDRASTAKKFIKFFRFELLQKKTSKLVSAWLSYCLCISAVFSLFEDKYFISSITDY